MVRALGTLTRALRCLPKLCALPRSRRQRGRQGWVGGGCGLPGPGQPIRPCERASWLAERTSGLPDWREDIPGQPLTPQHISDVVAWLAARRRAGGGTVSSKC